MKQRRPAGISIVSILLVSGGLISAVQMAMSSRIAFCTPEFISAVSNNSDAMGWFARRFGCEGYLFATWFLGLSAGLLGLGLWFLARWARVIFIATCGLDLLDQAIQVLVNARNRDFFTVTLRIVFAAVTVWLIQYMFNPDVRKAFSPSTS